jgi:hypothetical protein
MTGVPGGVMPWTGSRARSRELGYADAMREVYEMTGEMLDQRARTAPCEGNGVTAAVEAIEALAAVRHYAFDAWLLGDQPVMHPGMLAGWVGQWHSKTTPEEARRGVAGECG